MPEPGHRMLVVERPCRAELLLLFALVLAPAAAPAQTGGTVVVRLNDAVGDTIDLAERDSFGLFPNTAGFQHAVILALPGSEFYAQVTLGGTDTTTQVHLRIMPTDLERIRFLVDNHEHIAGQQRSDSTHAQSMSSFWHAVEDYPLRSIASEPPILPEATPVPTEAATAGEPPTEPVTTENRYNYALHGTTIGSAAGGCVGSHVAIEQVGARTIHYTDACSNPSSRTIPVYSINHPVYWGAACGLTALGATAGYFVGDKLDHRTLSSPTPLEGSGWRIGCAIGAGIPGLALGLTTFLIAGPTMYGKVSPAGEFENDTSYLFILPMALTGLCITVEMATIGYRIGRAIDRGNAAKAEARRRALGR